MLGFWKGSVLQRRRHACIRVPTKGGTKALGNIKETTVSAVKTQKRKMRINQNLKKEASRRGFTLIELIASIAIITVITALVVNRYGLVINDGRVAKQNSVINAIEKAKDMYVAEENRTTTEIQNFNAKTIEGRVADLLPYVRLNGLEVTAGSLLLEGTGRTSIDPGLLITNPAVTTGGTVTLN